MVNSKIYDYSADGFDTSDVLYGERPYISYQERLQTPHPFPIDSLDEVFNPIRELKIKIPTSERNIVVLSIGGNDIRKILSNMSKLEITSQQLVSNNIKIVDRIKIHTNKIVLMMQYRPCYSTDLFFYKVYYSMGQIKGKGNSKEKLNNLVKDIYSKIVEKAQIEGYPLIDLGNTFDILDNNLYVRQIEPSEIGGQIISGLINYVVQNHDWNQKKSQFYYIEKGQFKNRNNDIGDTWEIRI